MLKHPLTRRIAFNYWILGRDLRRRKELKEELKKKKALLISILELAKQIEESEYRINTEPTYIVKNIISPDTISALEWDIYYTESEIYSYNQQIKFYKSTKIWIPLG